MPESDGAGDSVTFTRLPECNPTPSSATDLRMVCCRMRHCGRATQVPHRGPRCKVQKNKAGALSRRPFTVRNRRCNDTPFLTQSLVYETAQRSHIHDDFD